MNKIIMKAVCASGRTSQAVEWAKQFGVSLGQDHLDLLARSAMRAPELEDEFIRALELGASFEFIRQGLITMIGRGSGGNAEKLTRRVLNRKLTDEEWRTISLNALKNGEIEANEFPPFKPEYVVAALKCRIMRSEWRMAIEIASYGGIPENELEELYNGFLDAGENDLLETACKALKRVPTTGDFEQLLKGAIAHMPVSVCKKVAKRLDRNLTEAELESKISFQLEALVSPRGKNRHRIYGALLDTLKERGRVLSSDEAIRIISSMIDNKNFVLQSNAFSECLGRVDHSQDLKYGNNLYLRVLPLIRKEISRDEDIAKVLWAILENCPAMSPDLVISEMLRQKKLFLAVNIGEEFGASSDSTRKIVAAFLEGRSYAKAVEVAKVLGNRELTESETRKLLKRMDLRWPDEGAE